MKHIISFIKKNNLLLLLLFFAFISRIGYLTQHIIPFNFDHGKDTLATMDLLLNLNLKFIGPWTSIPGLYFGPGWYYLLAPGLLLTNFNPVGPVLIMILLVLVQVCIAYKYFGRAAALVVATTPFWLMLSKSAWNPFPMTLLTWILIALMQRYKEEKTLGQRNAFLTGLTASFGFHFSAAFAIFYPVIILLFILKNKLKLTIKNIISIFFGFIIPFIPQLLFEIKNNFVQTKAVIHYFTQGESQGFGSDKISLVTRSYFSELFNFISPDLAIPAISQLFLLLFIGMIAFVLYKNKVAITNSKTFDILDFFICILIPYLGFLFLHYNVWYPYALAPVLVVFFTKLVQKQHAWVQSLIIILFILSPLVSYTRYFTIDRKNHEQSRSFLSPKVAAIDFIYDKSDGKPFASYHYVPDIYDYTYQYIYLWKARNGAPLPVDFSYKPNETAYIKEKPELLTQFPSQSATPEKIFYIVEKSTFGQDLDSWWGQQKFSSIISTTEIGPEITIYEALP